MTLISTISEPQSTLAEALSNRPVPKIRIAAFCETTETHDMVALAAIDRRMMRANIDFQMGGTKTAIRQYSNAPTPDLILLERQVPGDLLLEELGRLAEVCDAGTRVLVIGASNDIRFYRTLMDRGISDYLVSPTDAPTLITAIGRLYEGADAQKLGRTCAFIGAKGGVGSSTIAHNVASTLADRLQYDVILADMDLPFGTAGLDFNIDSAQGMVEALESGDKLDELLFERLLGKCSERLRMLVAPATLERPYDLGEEDVDAFVDMARTSASHVVLDMPHLWSSWARRMLVAADDVVVTAVPDLANMRNTKSLVEALRKARPNDAPPRLVLNQIGVPKRPEIKIADFVKAVGLDPLVAIPFDPKPFGTAANNGQMIFDVAARSAKPFAAISEALLESSGGKRRGGKGWGFLSRLSPRRRSA
ncbi:AAA family ATPase [Limimaricola soesokkakensis]|uniref:AAA family ATPase n=1 Tax=Limimaricola soesokkakensis TaxID=1343159 RepID=UPI003517C4E5